MAIAKWPPRGWDGPRASRFAPSDPKAEDWAGAYRHDLDGRFPTESSLRLYLQEIERETPDPILCCFELNPEECHRRVLAAYIKEKLNWDVPEWGSRGPEQASLL